MHQSLPRQAVRRNGLGEKYLDPPAAAVFSAAIETRRKNTRIVQHQAVAGPKIARKIAKDAVLPCPCLAVEDEHSRSRPVLQRLLRDQLVREMVVEFLEQHFDLVTARTALPLVPDLPQQSVAPLDAGFVLHALGRAAVHNAQNPAALLRFRDDYFHGIRGRAKDRARFRNVANAAENIDGKTLAQS